ncbi:MAG: hypothetical protein M1354_01575 [Candidatus Marsarchaeota archaeon]|nr:hypothetical protein [Candidatus Marsarchaeota archaeon]
MAGRAALLFSAALLALLAAGAANAAVPANAAALLRSYAVPNAIINNLQQEGINYTGNQYLALYNNGQLSFVYNASGNSLLMNQQEIFSVIKGYTLNRSIAQANFSLLVAQMHDFQSVAQPAFNDCLIETGFNQPNASCTFQNYCQSCKTVPYCSKVLTGLGGPDTPFGYGLMAFDSNYTSLQSNYTKFYAYASAVSPANINASLVHLNAAFANISLIASTIWENAIFPPPQNVSIAACGGHGAITGNVPVHAANWYCNAVGFCGFLTIRDSRAEGANYGINFTLLNDVNATLRNLSALPFSGQQIESIAAEANTITAQYAAPVLQQQKATALSSILNSTLAGYGPDVNASKALLGHMYNSSLATALSDIEGNHSKLLSQYLNLNLTQYNRTLASQLALLMSTYDKLNATYSGMLATAGSNTNTIIQLQLNGNGNNAQLSSLAFRQFALNQQLSGTVANAVAVQAQLAMVKSGLSGIGPNGDNPISALSRSIGSASAEAVAPIFGLPYSSNIALAPIFASMPAILATAIGLLILLAARLLIGRRKQATLTMQQKRSLLADTRILLALGAVLIIYLLLSMALSYSNNGTEAPVSVFQGAVQRAGTVALVLNGTQTPGMTYCAGLISSRLRSLHKSPVILAISGARCTVDNTTVAADACLNSYARRGLPIITLTNSSESSISVYALYGAAFTESGNSTSLDTCVAATAV